MLTEDSNTGLSADDLIGRIIVCDTPNTTYVVYVQEVLMVIVSGPSGNHVSRQVSGLLPENLTLHFLLSDVDRLATPEDLARLNVAERLSPSLPEEALIAFQGLM